MANRYLNAFLIPLVSRAEILRSNVLIRLCIFSIPYIGRKIRGLEKSSDFGHSANSVTDKSGSFDYGLHHPVSLDPYLPPKSLPNKDPQGSFLKRQSASEASYASSHFIGILFTIIFVIILILRYHLP